MDFYTSLFTATFIFLIITLCIVGYFMSLSKKNQTYPPAIANCPDYYSLTSTNSCKIGSNIKANYSRCDNENFDQAKYKKEGTDFNSGLCARKLWANECGVTWDGITNNDELCYA